MLKYILQLIPPKSLIFFNGTLILLVTGTNSKLEQPAHPSRPDDLGQYPTMTRINP
jgi:hypothetical protein